MSKKRWQFWIDDNGKMRLILVGIDNFEEARKIALSHANGGMLETSQELSEKTVEKLALSDRIIESKLIEG